MAGGDEEPGTLNLGDVILACETVGSEAQEQGVLPAHHLQHLVVHGLLHLLGFDHEEPQAAAEMERLEIEILASLGVADPYGDAELIAESAAPKAAGGRA
jgi:probable rRNA maturation factor